MARNLAKRDPKRTELSLAAEFEAAELLTLGVVYEDNLRFGGGAYSPMLKKVDRFTTKPLPAAIREREGYAKRLSEIDAQVKRIVGELQARGMKSPYLRSYVVARINPVRFHKAKPGDKKPAMPIAQALLRMLSAAKKFDLNKVNMSDLAFVAAGAESVE
jgi:ParB family chromosome partitioning protein